MAYWLELHCDVHRPAPADWPWNDAPCATDRNESPGVLVGNGWSDIKHAVRYVQAEALERGWTRIGARTDLRWACKWCSGEPSDGKSV